MRRLYYPDDPTEGGGGENPPKKVDAPKGYQTLSPIQRKNWNDFLDYLQTEGVGGKTDLDKRDQTLGLNYLNKYNKENPNKAIDPTLISSIQYEQQQLRSGESFAGMKPEETRVLRKQLSQDYLNRPVAPNTDSLGTSLSRSYYPEFKKGDKSYGTDAESYMKDFANPVWGKEKDDTIPKPDYNDQKSRNQYLKNWEKKYGDLEGRGDTVLKLNEVPRTGSDTMKNIAIKSAKQYGIDPALLYSSAMEEGASGLFKDKSGEDTKHRKPGEPGYEDYFGDKEYPISGGNSFGFQTFNQRFPELVKGGYLPKDFESKFRNKNATIETGKVESANDFKSVDDAMKAKAAMMKYGEDYVEKYAKEKDIKLSSKAKDFFTLAWFNGGEGGVHKLLKEYNEKGLLKDDKFLKENPDKGIPDNLDIWKHVAPRIKRADALKQEKLFDDGNTH
jgi:hypothetical protein